MSPYIQCSILFFYYMPLWHAQLHYTVNNELAIVQYQRFRDYSSLGINAIIKYLFYCDVYPMIITSLYEYAYSVKLLPCNLNGSFWTLTHSDHTVDTRTMLLVCRALKRKLTSWTYHSVVSRILKVIYNNQNRVPDNCFLAAFYNRRLGL